MATENKENEVPKQASAKVATKEADKVPVKKTTRKRKSTDTDNDGSKDNDQSKSAPAPKKTKTSNSKTKDTKDALPDVSDIQLAGDMEDEAPVYATATDIRRMLNNKFKEPGVTQAKFYKMANQASGKNINPRQLATFRNKKGRSNAVIDGTDSPVFYAAWCYFEKLRMKEGKAKSKHQLEMEEAHGAKGISRRGNKPLTLHVEESAWHDKYGRLVIRGRDGKESTMS